MHTILPYFHNLIFFMLTFPFYHSIEGFYFFTYLELLSFIFIPNGDVLIITGSRSGKKDESLGTIPL